MTGQGGVELEAQGHSWYHSHSFLQKSYPHLIEFPVRKAQSLGGQGVGWGGGGGPYSHQVAKKINHVRETCPGRGLEVQLKI